ncbi:hypothetical protein V495_05223 [Pseudogymnoascus sp. VKM F-4514 (FW-929)]|nr:hypothetical protein V495_05223 [Pseudogymnoascus sp. VKM F-4514 (FW-929)]KFY54864.1 hypothetical protein V497_07387 [Pseudogymnoascus sp. VKM F-4516 (FW-969)]
MVRKIKSENPDDWEGTYRSRAASPGTPKRVTRSTAKRGSGVAKLSDRSPHSHKKPKTSFQPAPVLDDHDETDEDRNESSIGTESTSDEDDEHLVEKQLVSLQREQRNYEAMQNAQKQQEREQAKRLMNRQKKQDQLVLLEKHRKDKEIQEKENLKKRRMEQQRKEQERMNERFKLIEMQRKEKARLEQEQLLEMQRKEKARFEQKRAAKDSLLNDENKSRELRLQEIYEKGRKAAMELSDPQPSKGREPQGAASNKIGKYDTDGEEDDDESGHGESDSESDGEEDEDGSGRAESDTESDDEDKNDDSNDEDDNDEVGDMSKVVYQNKNMGATEIQEDSEDQDEGEEEGGNSVHGSDAPILPNPRPQDEGLSACLRCIKNLAVNPEFSCVFTDDYDKCMRCSTRGRRCVPVPAFAHGDVCKLLALQKLHDAARPNIRPALRIRIQADAAGIVDKVRPEESRARKTQEETLRSILLGQVGIKHNQEEILRLLRELLSRHPVEKNIPVATGQVHKGKRRA